MWRNFTFLEPKMVKPNGNSMVIKLNYKSLISKKYKIAKTHNSI